MTKIDIEDVKEDKKLVKIANAVNQPGFAAKRRQILEFFRDDHALADRLIAKMIKRIRKYPSRDYCNTAKWTEQLVEDRLQKIWETVLNPAMSYFAKLAKAPPQEIAEIILGQIRKVMIAEAPPYFRWFYNQFIQELQHDQPLNRFATKKFAKQRFRGLRAWKNDSRVLCGSKSAEELVNFWRVEKKLRFPNMALGESLSREALRNRVYEMLKLLDEWAREKMFYASWKKLVNFPTARQFEQSLDRLPGDTDDDPEAVERYLDQDRRDLLGMEQWCLVKTVICENAEAWTGHFDRVFADFRPEQKKFLQFYYVKGLAPGVAAEKVGKAPSFATQTFGRIAEGCRLLREQLSSDELPALREFLTVYLLNMKPETGRTKK